MFLKVLMLIIQECLINIFFVAISEKVFKFQSSVFNGFHDILMMSIGISNIVILNIHGVDCRCVMYKRKATNLLRNTV